MACRHLNLGFRKLLEGLGRPMACCHVEKVSQTYLGKSKLGEITTCYYGNFSSSINREVE